MRFENRNVAIAAGGSGAGVACALDFLAEGASVALYYDDEGWIAPALEKADDEHLKLVRINDFSDADELISAGEELVSAWGKIDIAVAAINAPDNEKLLDMTEEEYQAIVSRISGGTLFFIQPLLKSMIEQDYGRVCVVMSIAGRRNLPGVSPAYAAANASLGGIVRNIASTAGVHYVTANAVAVTPLSDGSYPAGTREFWGIVSGHEVCTPEDVAKAAEYLCADLSSWTTGEILDLNGGAMML